MIRMGRLLETYGGLLTERQKEFVRLHCHGDLSFGEIAREYRVSRQAVHDAVRQAEAAMEHYEAELGLLGRPGRGRARADLSDQSDKSDKSDMAAALGPVVEKLENVRRRLAGQGVVYDVAEYVRGLDEVIRSLREQTGG
jgi:predicted DNA-binding protein YlxM (UPF0122 family)